MLPTVVMVILVVSLLTTAILIRSFDRSKNASNIRVDDVVLKAATPALDRARAKINRLFSTQENRLQGNLPPEDNIASVLNQSEYVLGDETQLELAAADFNGQAGIQPQETLQTAWKFPVDTDNNGRFDSFTLYGIYFRNPPSNPPAGQQPRKRVPIEARALPQDNGTVQACGGNGASDAEGWYQTSGQLKKAFFTYVATVPITQAITQAQNGIQPAQFETYRGNKGFSALEMQLDQARIALDNNAVWYEDDLVIANVPTLRLNGRIHTNSNLMVENPSGVYINFLQVSSYNSCYYDPDNAKIVVGGNVSAGTLSDTADSGNDQVIADLFRGTGTAVTTQNVNNANKTTTNTPPQVASNSDAYEKRLNVLINGGLNLYDQTPNINTLPFDDEIKKNFNAKNDSANSTAQKRTVLQQVLKTYFQERIRRVSYAEVPITDQARALTVGGSIMSSDLAPTGAGEAFVFSGQNPIQPPLEWMQIGTTNTGLTLNYSGSTMNMNATDPNSIGTTKIEYNIGDRIKVGNQLPTRWVKSASTPITYAAEGDPQLVEPGGATINWNDQGGGNSGQQRKRYGVAQQLDDLGDTTRNGYWEQAAAKAPPLDTEDLAGGLRVITGAGIYIDGVRGAQGTGVRLADAQFPNSAKGLSFLPPPPTVKELTAAGITLPTDVRNTDTVVWPDTMPMYQWLPYERSGRIGRDTLAELTDTDRDGQRGATEGMKGDLQMRATVVYHYTDNAGKDQTPIACISSYYDPTDSFTADKDKGISNNGINYPVPTTSRAFTLRLRKQARMLFPDGRWANEPLKIALDHYNTGGTTALTLADNAAIDAANCALSILDNPTGSSASIVPDGAIKEQAFLDARQVKALHKAPFQSDGTTPIPATTSLADITDPEKLKIAQLSSVIPLTSDYTLPIEQRQPMEIRVTQIDLSQLINVPIGTGTGTGVNNNQEYLLPNSGLIYASRDDALPDFSSDENAATDFKLDPTRRPNGIRLINGINLARVNTARTAEKGLILASDLPVYIKGDFNKHYAPGTTTGDQLEEFTTKLSYGSGSDPGNFYTRSGVDSNFACRKGSGTKCQGGTGDQWRAARILSDAVTLLSGSFNDGYRSDGDYDFNNNAGNVAVEARLKNGFWWNSFATTGNWYNTTGPNSGLPLVDFDVSKPGNQGSSSYVMNDVTPIQRRVRSPQYLMEACSKRPVSECGPQDWVFAYQPGNPQPASSLIGNPIPAKNLSLPLNNLANSNAGTTSRPAIGTFANYVRRVAFKRDVYGGLEMPPSCSAASANALKDCNAQPLGVYPTGIKPYSYGVTPPVAPAVSNVPPTGTDTNTLWYWTTTNSNRPHNDPTDLYGGFGNLNNFEYNNNKALFYLPPEPETVTTAVPTVHERQLFLPGIEFPSPDATRFSAAFNQAATYINQLNGATTTDPSDYAVCTGSGTSQDYNISSLSGSCPGLTRVKIRRARDSFAGLTATNDLKSGKPVVAIGTPMPEGATTFPSSPATAKINVYDLPASGNLGTAGALTINLERGSQSNPIFVFRMPVSSNNRITFGQQGVKLNLNGVSPNNIFWVSNRGMQFAEGPHQLAGNFLGTTNLQIAPPSSQKIFGGRFLGFNSSTVPANFMTAMTTTNQPLLVPVLQLHSPTGSPSANLANAFGNDALNDTWLPKATTTSFNGVFIMGDSPSRPLLDAAGTPLTGQDAAEYGGGLGNFPRFLEAWEDNDGGNLRVAKISGGLIQFKKSEFATAPFEAIDNSTRDVSLFFDGATPDYMANYGSQNYRYRGGASGAKAPYYRPPERQWGYDVGLLSQSPDLFSRRFATPSAGTPNEYYREVGRDDDWVKTLLCGVEKRGAGKQYTITDAKQRPTCSISPAQYPDFPS